MSLSTVARSDAVAIDAQAILDGLLFKGIYKPESNEKRHMVDALRTISPRTLTGEYATNGLLVFFAVDPSLSEINEMTDNLANPATTGADLFVFLHVSEKHAFNGYYELLDQLPNEDATEERFLAQKKGPSELEGYLNALKGFTDVLCTKVSQWKHIILVLPFDVCIHLGNRPLAESGEMHPDTASLITFGLTQTPRTWLPPPVVLPGSGTVVPEIYTRILKAPRTKNNLLNLLFLQLAASNAMLDALDAATRERKHPASSDASEAPVIPAQKKDQPQLVPVPLDDFVNLSLRYIHVILPIPAVNVHRILFPIKETIEHAVVTLTYGSFEHAKYDIFDLPNLEGLTMTFGHYGEVTASLLDSPPIGLLMTMKLPAVMKINLTWKKPLHWQPQAGSELLGLATGHGPNCDDVAIYINKCIGSAVGHQGRARCSLRVEHFDDGVVVALQRLVQDAGWFQAEIVQGGL